MATEKTIQVGSIEMGNVLPFVLIAGPDSIESGEHCLFMAESLKEICVSVGVPFIFKACFDKANRTSVDSFRGVGINEGVKILKDIKIKVGVPITTDIHLPEQAAVVSAVVDLIQVPALLSRQTDMLVAAGQTGKPVNVKKGQFIAPHNIQSVIDKVCSTGNESVAITERGYMFGYNNVVVDMRGLEIMKRETGHPIILDCSHTVQFPSQTGHESGGDRTLTPAMARAGIAVGIAGIFMEVHDTPNQAKVDGPSSFSLSELPKILTQLKKIDQIVKQ